jgi:hypothetical protein
VKRKRSIKNFLKITLLRSSLIIFFILNTLPAVAQIIKGKIMSPSGEPVPYATVYIQQLRQGTTANALGDYEIKLSPGTYQVTYQSLGYSPLTFEIVLTSQIIEKDVILPLQYYQIPEVRITATGEDPAYGIMRKTIGMAPYYLNNISHYKADVYIKGNLVFNKLPRLLQKQMTISVRNEKGTQTEVRRIKEGDVFMIESMNEVEFTAPDKYIQKVISVNSTLPEQDVSISPMDLIQASFYEPLLADIAISPLSPQAFSHYRFRYLGATSQGDNIINKIQVTPKVKSQQLFEGTITIIEDLWCLQSVDLTNDNIAGKINIQQLYVPVQDDIWMPVSHKFVMNIGIIGVRADAEYGSSVRYIEVKPNESLQKPASVTSDFFKGRITADEATISRNQQKIEEILTKEELSNRDMVRLSRIMKKESEESIPDSIRKNLEVKDNTTRMVDENAGKKDSAYWAAIRPIPLSELEMKSLRIRDSVRRESSLKEIRNDSITDGTQDKKRFTARLSRAGFGHTWSDTAGLSFNFGGLINSDNFSFNTVDGFVYGIDFRLSKRWKNNSTLSLSPEIKWAFSREALLWRFNGSYSFDRIKHKQLFFRTGMISRDISTGGSINTLLNTVTTLFMERNYLKLYDTKYVIFGYREEIVNGLSIELTAGYDKRKVLENNTSFSLINTSREYSDNVPDNDYLVPGADPDYSLRDQDHYEIVTNVTFTPRRRYRISNGTKVALDSDWPTFEFTWKHGINEFTELAEPRKHFDMLKFYVGKETSIGAFSSFYWRIGTGGYLDKSWLTYYDFFHFNAQPLPLLINDYQDAFRLPSYYSLSTPEFYGDCHIKFTTPYLMLKYLPGLSKTLMRENISLSYLGSRFHGNYTEIGYSISEISFIGELGVFAGFEDLKYKDIGLRLVLKLR